MSKFDVVVVGSFNFDMTCVVDAFPSKGETKIGSSFSTGCGGKGTNQCTQAARLGAKTALICKIGSDSFASNLLSLCSLENISQQGIYKDTKAPTGVAQITVDSEGENCIVVAPGANYNLSVEDVDREEDLIRGSRVLVCQNEIREAVSIAALKIARRYGTVTVMNAAPSKDDFQPELFNLSDVFIVNCFEAQQITKMEVATVKEAEDAARVILEKGCKSVIVTMGKEGLVYLSDKEKLFIPSTKVKVIDSTGAGDSFVGALAFFMSTAPDQTMKEILSYSSYVAAVSVQKVGAQGGMPRIAELPVSLHT